MNVQELQELLAELMQVIQEVMASGEILSDEFQAQLAQTLELLYSRIEELERVTGIPNPPPLEPANHESAQINAYKYDPQNEDLYVKFQDKYPGQNGPIYRYEGVPENTYNLFARGAVAPKTTGKNAWHAWKKNIAPSLGASANALLKAGGFQYQRMS
jgi:hypothetical protein